MSQKEDIKTLSERVDRLRDWTKEQETLIGKLQIDTAVQDKDISLQRDYMEGQFSVLREALEKHADAITVLQGEFSKHTLKIIIWSVSFVLGLLGLIFGVWKLAMSI